MLITGTYKHHIGKITLITVKNKINLHSIFFVDPHKNEKIPKQILGDTKRKNKGAGR